MRRILVLMGLVLVLGSGCRRQDVRTAVIHVPGLKSVDCVAPIMKALETQQGVPAANVAVDWDLRVLRIRYDSVRTALKNLEFTIADAGYDANDIPASPEARARLPEECR